MVDNSYKAGDNQDPRARASDEANAAYHQGRIDFIHAILQGGMPGADILSKYLTSEPQYSQGQALPVQSVQSENLEAPANAKLRQAVALSRIQLNTPSPQSSVQLNTPLEYTPNKLNPNFVIK